MKWWYVLFTWHCIQLRVSRNSKNYLFIHIYKLHLSNKPAHMASQKDLEMTVRLQTEQIKLVCTYLHSFSLCWNKELMSWNILLSELASERWSWTASTYTEPILWNRGLFHKGGRSKVESQITTKQVNFTLQIIILSMCVFFLSDHQHSHLLFLFYRGLIWLKTNHKFDL